MRLLVLNVVGLTQDLLGEATPHLNRYLKAGSQGFLGPVFPAVTSSVQSTLVTGTLPAQHGSVGNGWYFKDFAEIMFWKQSHHLVRGERLWEAAKNKSSSFTSANLFWWYNMYTTTDHAVTVRPLYPADGRKIPDIYCSQEALRHELNRELGAFPLFHFWGPKSNIVSSQWIAECAKSIERKYSPNLSLVYLPHLDYNLQRLGPRHPDIQKDLREIDAVVGGLLQMAEQQGMHWMVLSEYGITEVTKPIMINKFLRNKGWLKTKDEYGTDHLDAGASEAFAVVDHQVAHVYVKDKKKISEIKKAIEYLPGVEKVELKSDCVNHERSGDLIATSKAHAWFCYYHWLDDNKAPDYARTVDIHRKPGYDPTELFIDPAIRFPMLKVGSKLLQKKMGLRTLMDVIPLKPEMVKGSHGRIADHAEQGPILLASDPGLLKNQEVLPATQWKGLVLDWLQRTEVSVGTSAPENSLR